jgi:hypothetical protein
MLLLFNEQTINGNGLYNEKTQKKKKNKKLIYTLPELTFVHKKISTKPTNKIFHDLHIIMINMQFSITCRVLKCH